jgi:carboxyl-terminal processing protease
MLNNSAATSPKSSMTPKEKVKFLTSRFFFVIALVLVFLTGFLAALKIAHSSAFLTPYKLDRDLLREIPFFDDRLYAEVYGMLKERHVDKGRINDQELFYGALKGMVDAVGDPYTTYFDPETNSEFNDELRGSFEGIGAEIGIKKDRLTVIAPLANSPAEQAGLRAGDIILAVDKQETIGLSLDEVIGLIRGDKGTIVVLNVYRDEDSFDTQDISITRDEIIVPSVNWRIQDDIAIINLHNFNSESDKQFTSVLLELATSDISGIILNLRNNPGGFLDKAVNIASAWVEPGQLVVREIFHDARLNQEYLAQRQIRAPVVPTIVLVNEGSASASEIVAGALQDHKLATIIGRQTYGKGSVQDLRSLSDGSGLKITIAQWVTPNGHIITEQGIEPDVDVELTLENYLNDEDPQLEKALQSLKELNQ